MKLDLAFREDPIAMHMNDAAVRTSTIDGLFGQICRATPQEARDLSLLVTVEERADLALHCYTRTHTREQARAIASACSRESLVRAGGQAGEALFDQVDAGRDTWGATARPEKRRVSLAGR